MALADESDVENALGRPLADGEDVSTLLESASDLVCGHIGYRPGPTDAVVADGVAARVVAMMVASVLTKPAITTSDYDATGYNTAREYASVRVGVESATTSGPWMTKSFERQLKPYRVSFRSVPAQSELYE